MQYMFANKEFASVFFQVTATVDGGFQTKWTQVGNFSDFSSRILYVGGTLNSPDLKGSRAIQSFYGCLKEVNKHACHTVTHMIMKLKIPSHKQRIKDSLTYQSYIISPKKAGFIAINYRWCSKLTP